MVKARRKIGAVAAAFLITASMSVTAFAADSYTPPEGTEQGGTPTLVQQDGDGYSSITIYDGVTEVEPPQYTGEMQSDFSDVGEPNLPKYYPFEITNVDERGTWLVVKSYEVPAGVDPQTDLVEHDMYRDGKLYEARDILQKKTPGSTDSREASKSVTITSASKDKAAILEQLDEQTFYSEGGYEGYLTLDESSIKSEVSGTSNYSYPVTEKKEYTGLARNDPSLIEKSIVKNGVTLNLGDVSWVPMGSTVSGDSIVSTYKAVATYSGTAYGSKADGYIVTAEYKGTVTKEVAGDYIYSIIYAPATEQPQQEENKGNGGLFGIGSDENKESQQNNVTLGDGSNGGGLSALFAGLSDFGVGPIRGWGFFALIVLIGIMIAGVVLAIKRIKERQSEEDYDEPKPEHRAHGIKGLRKSKADEGAELDSEDEAYDESEYESDDDAYTPEEGDYEPEPEPDYDSIELGDDMRIYMQGDEDILNISADGDPELSSVFEGKTNSRTESEKEPLEFERQ